VRQIIRAALTQAVRWRWALHQTCRPRRGAIRTPQRPRGAQRRRAYRQVLSEARPIGPEIAVLLRISVATGARRGEGCGVRWNDLRGDGSLRITLMDDGSK